MASYPSVGQGELRKTPLHEERDFQGLPLIIEYHKGDRKPDKDDPDSQWGYLQHADYGYIDGTTSNEVGEGIDVFVGDDEDSECAFLCPLMYRDQPEVFMEYKVLLGFEDHKCAKKFAECQYSWGMLGPIIEMTVEDLKDWANLEKPMADKLDRNKDDDEDDDYDDDDEEEGEIATALDPDKMGEEVEYDEHEEPDIMEAVDPYDTDREIDEEDETAV